MRECRIGFLLLFLCSLCLTSCADKQPLSSSALAVVYTHANQKDSELLLLDQQGQAVTQTSLPAMGIFQIIHRANGGWMLPVQFSDQIYQISPQGKITREASLLYPLFVAEDMQIQVSTYNTKLHSGTLQIKDLERDKQHRLLLPGFLRMAAWDSHHVYVFSSLIQQKRSVLYQIDRQTGKRLQTIPLPFHQVSAMLISQQRLLLTSTATDQLAMLSLPELQLETKTLPYAGPEHILVNGEELMITYQGQPYVTRLDATSLRVVKNNSLQQPVFRAEVADGKLYVLSQIQSGSVGGQIGIYDPLSGRLLRRISLPSIRDTLVQDFSVIPQENKLSPLEPLF